MKNTLLVLFVVVMFVSCTIGGVEIENSIQKTTAPQIGQILTIKYQKDVTEGRMREIRDYYFRQCYSDAVIARIYYYSVEMYNPYPQDTHKEFWKVISCNNGKPGGIGGGMPGEIIIN